MASYDRYYISGKARIAIASTLTAGSRAGLGPWYASLKMIAAQCRAGRGLLNMTVKELAARARVATDTIVRLENGREMKPLTIDAVRMALEEAGVEFLPAGVRLKGGPMCGWAERR